MKQRNDQTAKILWEHLMATSINKCYEKSSPKAVMTKRQYLNIFISRINTVNEEAIKVLNEYRNTIHAELFRQIAHEKRLMEALDKEYQSTPLIRFRRRADILRLYNKAGEKAFVLDEACKLIINLAPIQTSEEQK